MIGCNQDACGLIRISQHPPMFIAAVNGFGLDAVMGPSVRR
jgi:hypothetical protein